MPPRKAPITVQSLSDFGTAELHKRHHTTMEQPDPNDLSTRRIRVENDQISWYSRRNYITQPQADALNRWQRDAYLAGLTPSCTGSFEPSVNGNVTDISDTRLAAQSRRDHAVKLLDGVHQDFVALTDAVCLQGQSAGRYMLARFGTPPDEAMRMLQSCGQALAVHWGMER